MGDATNERKGKNKGIEMGKYGACSLRCLVALWAELNTLTGDVSRGYDWKVPPTHLKGGMDHGCGSGASTRLNSHTSLTHKEERN